MRFVKFKKVKENIRKTIDSFTDRLRTEAKKNGINNFVDNVRLLLITGAISSKIRVKAEAEDLRLENLVNFARAAEYKNEQSHVQQYHLHEFKQKHVNHVHKHYSRCNSNYQYQQQKQAVNGFNQQNLQAENKSNMCCMCGYEYPHNGDSPAQDKQCNRCGRFNDFTKF